MQKTMRIQEGTTIQEGTKLVDADGNVHTVSRMERYEPEPISITGIYIERDGLGFLIGIREGGQWKVVFHSKKDVDKLKLLEGALHNAVLAETYHGEEHN